MAEKKPELSEFQRSMLGAYSSLYDRRFDLPLPEVEEDERPPLSTYRPEIQRLLGGSSFQDAYSRSERAAMTKMLQEAGKDPESFFQSRPDASTIDVMLETNYDGYADRKKLYDSEETFSSDFARNKGIEKLNKEYQSKFESAKILPGFGADLNQYIPESISKNPERQADFEKAVFQQYGLKLDFNDSGGIGDVRTDSMIGNAFRFAGEKINRTWYGLVEGGMELTQALYDLGTSLDIGRSGVLSEPLRRLDTPEEVAERIEKEDVLEPTGESFWRALYVPEARDKYIRSRRSVSTIDFQAIADGAEHSFGDLVNSSLDSTLDSAVIIADLYAGKGVAKLALKKAAKRVGERGASKVAKRASGRFADPKTGRFMSKEAVGKIQKRTENYINFLYGAGTVAATDVIMSGHIHAQNSEEEWYQNLSPQEKFFYLANQSTAETLSAIAFERVLSRGFGGIQKALMTHTGSKAKRNFVKEFGKNFAQSFFPSMGIEGFAEAGTAAWQYASEIYARQAGGDETAVFTWPEFWDRTIDAGLAGMAMGGFTGGVGGLTRAGISAYVSAFHPNGVKGNKEIEKAREAVRNANTKEEKEKAAQRLSGIIEKHAGAKTSIARAYYRLAGLNPEAFEEIVGLQEKINEAVHRYKKADGDPEAQETQKRVLEDLIQQKRDAEDAIAREEGAESFDDFIKQEVEALAEQNKEKARKYESERQNSPEAEAERIVEEELDAQRASLEAAQEVNSPDQNSDDDTQDQQGESKEEEDQDLDSEYTPNENDQVVVDPGGEVDPGALKDDANVPQEVKDKFQDIASTVNNLVKAFTKGNIGVVLHKTRNSFVAATKEDAGTLGSFRDGKVHLNLVEMAKDGENLFRNTLRHEFLHAAFKSLTPAQKAQFVRDLVALNVKITGKDGRTTTPAQIAAAVRKNPRYKGLSKDKLNEEIAVTILELLLDSDVLTTNQSVFRRVANIFRRLIGRAEITESDLEGFVRRFRDAERTGAEFEGAQAPGDADASARLDKGDLFDKGMNRRRIPSKAYPDLINKVVNYRVIYLDRLGGQQSYQTNGLRFKDYWHFRNWYIKETGNGKMADNIGGFTYMGDDGTLKKINPPKPKRDKETGEIIDMVPRLRTPQQKKMDRAERETERRKKAIRYKDIRMNAGKALKFAVGKIEKIDKTGELTFYNENMLLEQDSRSELPVVYSETFFTDGLNVDELDQLGTDFGNNLEFLIPTSQEAQLAFTVTNNGDGTVTIDAHSDLILLDNNQTGAVIKEGEADSESLASSKLDNLEYGPKSSATNKRYRELIDKRIKANKFFRDIEEIAGLEAILFAFDRTGDFSGIEDLIADPEKITAHVDTKTADSVEGRLYRLFERQAEKMGLIDADGNVLQEGAIGYAAVVFSLLAPEATLANPRVASDAIKNRLTKETLTKKLSQKTATAFRRRVRTLITDAGVEPQLKKKLSERYNYDLESLSLTDAEFDAIISVLSEDVLSTTFDKRAADMNFLFDKGTKAAKVLRQSIIDDANDKAWAEFENKTGQSLSGQVAGFARIPFIVKKAANGKVIIEGIEVVKEQKEASVKPFQGVIRHDAEAFEGQEVDLPQTFLTDRRVDITDLFPGTLVKVDVRFKGKGKKLTEEGELRRQTDVDKIDIKTEEGSVNMTIEEIRDQFDPETAEQIITAQMSARARNPLTGEAASVTEPENETVDASARLDLFSEPENDSSLPFEPNSLNSFQAFMARMDQLFANKYANVFSLQRAVEGAKKAVVDISQDFINAETLMYGKTANDLEKLDEKVKVISQEMKDAGLIGEDVSQFLIARHAEERNALIAERTDGETLNGSGMSNERAQEVMDSFSPEQKAALESIAKKVDAITKDTRQTMVKFGLESQETIDAFEEMFDNYVPLGGLSVDEMTADTSLYPTGGAGMSIYGDTTRRARGRASEANNVLAQAIAQNAAVHAKARKNEALSSLYNLVENNPNSRVWKISNEAPFDAQGAVGVRVNGEQKFIVFTNPDHAKALKNMGVEKLDLFSKIMRSFSGFLRRSFTTANPEFIISNFARDIQSALFNAMAEADIPGGQIQSKYIATKIIERVKQTLPALLKGAVGKDLDPEMAAYFEDFKEDGGQTGWGFVKDVGTIAAEIEAEVSEKNKAQKARDWMMKNSIDVVENVNDAFENSIRLAAYMEARKAGTSREKAAELAKNITVNFNRSGELGAVANAWYMFFNASVQGTVRLARSLGTLKDVRKPNGELESWHKRLNAAQKMAFGLSLTTGMLTAINLAMSEEDEDGVLFYNKIPDYEKERNLIIMYDGQNYLKIPLPYGFNVFANMGSAMAEVAGGQRDMTDAGMFLLNSAFSSFSPVSFGQSKDAAKYLAKGATPTIFKPLVDIAVNESYFGSSVYKEQFPVGAPKPEAEMSFRAPEGVRSFFKWMNEATGGSEFVPGKADFNPDKFWYGFEYYIGGAGQFVTRTLGTGRDAYEMIKEGEKVPMKANDFPFLRKLYGEFSKYYDSDVYVENANLVSQLYKERKEAENKRDNRYRGVRRLESSRKRTEKQIKRLRQQRKEARDIKNYVERQNRIYELYEKERSLLMQFNKQFEQLRGKD